MTTAAMMRASTATNAPATDVTGDALATVGGGVAKCIQNNILISTVSIYWRK